MKNSNDMCYDSSLMMVIHVLYVLWFSCWIWNFRLPEISEISINWSWEFEYLHYISFSQICLKTLNN